jgi:hypothetical protein
MGVLRSYREAPAFAPGFSFSDYCSEGKPMKVDKQRFDALLGALLTAKPLPKAEIEPKTARAGRTVRKPAKQRVRRP